MVAVSASSVQKRVPGGGTASRRRVPADATATDLDMAVVTDQLCNRRYHVKELSLNMKVGLADWMNGSIWHKIGALWASLLAWYYAVIIDVP